MRIRDQQRNLRDIARAAVLHQGLLRDVTIIIARVNGELRVVWRKPQTAAGWVFTQGRPIAVSGRFIRLKGQQ